jgi:hypothetical protein
VNELLSKKEKQKLQRSEIFITRDLSRGLKDKANKRRIHARNYEKVGKHACLTVGRRRTSKTGIEKSLK